MQITIELDEKEVDHLVSGKALRKDYGTGITFQIAAMPKWKAWLVENVGYIPKADRRSLEFVDDFASRYELTDGGDS